MRSKMLLIGLVALASTAAHAAAPASCAMRLTVELTPDVPNPRDAGFLSSLLSERVDYRLNWVRRDSASEIVLELTGPGPAEECRDVVQTMRNDGRVLSIHTDGDDLQAVAVTTNSAPPKLRFARNGLGSLYWAAQHPAQAWKIVAPINLSLQSRSDYDEE